MRRRREWEIREAREAGDWGNEANSLQIPPHRVSASPHPRVNQSLGPLALCGGSLIKSPAARWPCRRSARRGCIL